MRTWLAQEVECRSYSSSYWIGYKSTGQEIPKYVKWLIRGIWAQACMWRPIEGDERVDQPLTSMIQVQESQ